ncbi:MAG: choline-sulfatase [Casimicrobiaceae bacterium]
MSESTEPSVAVPARRAGGPNVVLIQVDQLAPRYLSFYGHPRVKTPNLDRLAARSVVFDQAYCNYPLCSPSRASMLTGCLPFSISQWDNGAEFFAEIPTLAHYLRAAGYSTTLCGKMHFVGPDQHHGYEERLLTDIYPSDFAWTTDWQHVFRPGGGIRIRNVVESGVCVRALQIDYDEEVEFHARRKLFDLARDPGDRPFFLTVSFSHPHPPFVITPEYWDFYADADIDMPRLGAIPPEQLDPFNRARWAMMGHQFYDLDDDHVRRARHAYFGMISYVDAKIGAVLDALRDTGLEDDTIVVFTSDHGEMLGERGMWLKDTFFEDAIRVPLLVAGPGVTPRRMSNCVSLVDLAPTVLDLVGATRPPASPFDGASFARLLAGEASGWKDEVIADWAGGGHDQASRMLRQGRFKYLWHHGLAPMLFDLVADPDEQHDLAGSPSYAEVEATLRARLAGSWDPAEVSARVRVSQQRRLFLQDVFDRSGKYSNWSAQVALDDAHRFVRGRASSFYAKARLRFPFVEPVPPDHPEAQ